MQKKDSTVIRSSRVAQIKRHHFTFEWYWTAVFVTTKKQVKQVTISEKSADKYYQTAKPDDFLFTIEFR